MEKIEIEIETIEVHNVWTLYGMNRDGTESKDKLAQFSRPQDWGDSRWVYHLFTLTWEVDGKRYINHAHCWTDLKRESWQYPQLFASLIAQISIPGEPPELCGNKFLHEDDFWVRNGDPGRRSSKSSMMTNSAGRMTISPSMSAHWGPTQSRSGFAGSAAAPTTIPARARHCRLRREPAQRAMAHATGWKMTCAAPALIKTKSPSTSAPAAAAARPAPPSAT